MKKLQSNLYLIIFENETTGETKETYYFAYSKNINKLARELRYFLFNTDDVVTIKIFKYIRMLYDEDLRNEKEEIK